MNLQETNGAKTWDGATPEQVLIAKLSECYGRDALSNAQAKIDMLSGIVARLAQRVTTDDQDYLDVIEMTRWSLQPTPTP